jgi:hypothetical protein
MGFNRRKGSASVFTRAARAQALVFEREFSGELTGRLGMSGEVLWINPLDSAYA